MFLEAITEGFRLTHRNLQLVYLRIVLILINIAVFFLFIVMPLFGVIQGWGMDISEPGRFLNHLLHDPLGLISNYLWSLLLFLLSFIIYLFFVTILYLYYLSGSLGILVNSALDPSCCFSLSSFFAQARKNFMNLIWLTSIIGIFFLTLIVIFFITAFVAGGGMHARGMGFFENFLASFLSYFVSIFGFLFLIILVVFMAYSIVAAVAECGGVTSALKKAFAFLIKKPSGFFFYAVLLSGVILASAAVFLFEISVSTASDGNFAAALLTAFLNLFLHSYIMVVMWACLVVFYVRAFGRKSVPLTYDI